MQRKDGPTSASEKRAAASETSARPLGVNQMHVRAGSSKYNNQISKKSGEPPASKAGSSSMELAGEASSADLKKAPGAKKLAN